MKKNIGAALGLYLTPVVVVGTYDKNGNPNIATLAWVGVCCSEPPCLQISVRKSRYTHDAITERGVFSVNVPSTKYAAETDYAGLISGRDAEKFEVAGLTPVRGELLDVPTVLEFPISMECRLLHTLEVGSHDLFVGEVAVCWVDEGITGGDGKPSPKELDPLLFTLGGGYFGLGGAVAPGFSAGKKFLK